MPKHALASDGSAANEAKKRRGAIEVPYTLKIWHLTQEKPSNQTTEPSANAGQKKQHNQDVMIFKIRTRACNDLRLPMSPQRQWHLRLGIRDDWLNMRYPFPQVYIGLSSVHLKSAFMSAGKGHRKPSNDLSNCTIKTEPGLDPCENSVILHELCTVPGNVKHLKLLVNEPGHGLLGCPKPFVSIPQDHQRWSCGLSIDPPFQYLPVESGFMQPDLQIGQQERRYSFWDLKWPPLGVLGIPPEMVFILEEFLGEHPMDPMPINLAVAATIIYFDMEARGWDAASYSTTNPVPPVPLGIFLLYFPHLLRFTEVRRLTRYVHPVRFCLHHYEADRQFLSDFRVLHEDLDTVKLRKLWKSIFSKSNDVPVEKRLILLPHSMPGTRLVWPKGTGSAERPSQELNSLALLNDIRTIMLPSYHQRDSGLQAVGFPRHIAQRWVKGEEIPAVDSKTPLESYWLPEMKGEVTAMTGSAANVGPVFCDLKPANTVILQDAQPERRGPPSPQLPQLPPPLPPLPPPLSDKDSEMTTKASDPTHVWKLQPSVLVLSEENCKVALKILCQLPHKAEEWNALVKMLSSCHEVPFADFNKTLENMEAEICADIREMKQVCDRGHVFSDNAAMLLFMKSLPRSIMKLTGLYPKWVLESTAFGDSLGNLDFTALSMAVGIVVADFLTILLPLIGPGAKPEHVAVYWVVVKPLLEELLKEPFINLQESLVRDLTEAIGKDD